MIKKIEKLDIQRRVVQSTNGHQFFVEELFTVRKLGVWKIAKIYYSYRRAKREIEKMK